MMRERILDAVGARRLGEVLARTMGASVAFVSSDGTRTVLAGDGPAGPALAVPVLAGDSRLGEVHVVGVLPEQAGIAREMALLIAEELVSAAPPGVEAELLGTDAIVGESASRTELVALLRKVALSASTALIVGENGTGKELCARAIHSSSPRAHRRFVAVNCSSLNDNLLDSELFGHKRGAFTGAVTDRPGLLDLADGGTFLLDEVADMSPAMQVKLLRVLEDGTFLPVGSDAPRSVDARILGASNRDLHRMVERGEFREDLFYRLNVITIRVAPLRERRGDIAPLARHFLRIHAAGRPVKRITEAALDRLVAYHWPGNVRELENEIERLVVLAGEQRVVDESLLSPRILEPGAPPEAVARAVEGTAPKLHAAVESLERRLIADALRRHGGNKTRAAKDLGVSRRNLIRLVRRYHLQTARESG